VRRLAHPQDPGSMHPDLRPISERVAALCSAARRDDGTVSAQAVESVLCDGYAEALAADAWSAQTERRMQQLIIAIPAEGAARELRTLARGHTEFQQQLMVLRQGLAALRAQFERLTADRTAA
jgi:hypothetical protein